jgi:hypothetical protein
MKELPIDFGQRSGSALSRHKLTRARGIGARAGNIRAGTRYLAKRGAVAKGGERKTARWRLATESP